MILSNNRIVNWLLLVIVLSDLLQMKASDYLFDIFKLFLLVKASNLSFNLKIGGLKKIEKFKTMHSSDISVLCHFFSVQFLTTKDKFKMKVI
jgi:hypothetical protein